MIIFEENVTREHDGKKFTDDIERGKITCDDEIIRDYCILGADEQKVLLRSGITISQVPITEELEELVVIFTSENKKEKPVKQSKKSTKKDESGKE